MRTRFIITAALGAVLAAPALAQTAPAAPPPGATREWPAPPTTPTTPPGGVARGVLQPRVVDPGMVAPPPANMTTDMPVIHPPGTAR